MSLINSRQNCLIALTSVHGAHVLPGELQGCRRSPPPQKPRPNCVSQCQQVFKLWLKFTWLGPKSDPSHESDDFRLWVDKIKHDLNTNHSWLHLDFRLLTRNNLKGCPSPNIYNIKTSVCDVAANVRAGKRDGSSQTLVVSCKYETNWKVNKKVIVILLHR